MGKSSVLVGIDKISVSFFLVVFFVALCMCSAPVFSFISITAHTSSAELQPEWSAAGQLMDYTVTITNQGPDAIKEVRIYQNPNYTDFQCEEKTDWTLVFVENYPDPELGTVDLCWYFTDNSHAIPYGSHEDFEFSATTPDSGCNWNWKFETRDIETSQQGGAWMAIYDTTSVDDKKPIIIKTLGEPKIENGETWITQDTPINIEAYDQGDCGISGIDHCEYRYDVDGTEVLPWTEISWDSVTGENIPHYFYTFTYNRDSEHFLEIKCFDIAGNEAYHSQTERVDSTPPETTKTYGDPHYPADINSNPAYPHWITTSTPITLTAPDGGNVCAIGTEKMWYYDQLVPDMYCENEYNPQANGVVFTTADSVIDQVDSCHPVCPSPYDVMYNGDISCAEYAQDICLLWNLNLPCHINWLSWEDCVEDYVNNCVGCGCDSTWKLYRGTPITKDEESCHVLQFLSADYLGNYEEMNFQCVYVDDTPPEQIKTVGTPNIPCECGECSEFDYWVRDDSSLPGTEITLDCDDSWDGEANHPVDHETICYNVSYDMSPYDLTSDYCDVALTDGWCCVTPPKTIVFVEDSLHDLEFYCIDGLGNENEETDLEYFRVDSQPPVITKTMIGTDHLGDCPPVNPGDECYVRDDGENGVHIDVADDDVQFPDCAVGLDQCEYGLLWYTTQGECANKYPGHTYDSEGRCVVESGNFGEEGINITFHEDSTHELYVDCWDLLGNRMPQDKEEFLVDSTPPETTKTYGDPQKVDPFCAEWCYVDYCVAVQTGAEKDECAEKCEHNFCTMWITSDTPVKLTAEDEKVGQDYPTVTKWRNLYFPNNPEICQRPPKESIPNCVATVEMVADNCNPDYYAPFVPGYSNEVPVWNTYSGEFFKSPESCHVIEYYSVDALGNEEIMDWQCVFVDNTPPEGIKEIGYPKIPCKEPVGPECWWVRDHVTPITLDCIDQGPHPVKQETVCYRVSFNYSEGWNYNKTEEYCGKFGGTMEGDWCCDYVGDEPYEFVFTEDSLHDLEFYCRDHLNNTEQTSDLEYFKVDSIPPNTTKTHHGPYYVNNETGATYIDTASWINLTAEDGGEVCAVGVKDIYWQNLVYEEDDEWYCQSPENCAEWNPKMLNPDKRNTYDGSIYKEEESCHVFAYYAEDELGNKENISWQCFFVDKRPPIIEKNYGDPYFEEGDVEWISSNTPIRISAYDPEPHPSGVKEVVYRVSLVRDENCWNKTTCETVAGAGEWTPLIGDEVHIRDESCHLIEINATDNVDKRSHHRQCVFVDNTPPTPDKKVGDPKEIWTPRDIDDPEYDGDTSYFYPQANELCWTLPEEECREAGSDTCLECWKVTKDTYIDMSCSDPDPHPVNHEKVCFNVELDGLDATEDYCEDYEGSYNETGDGFCCLDSTIEDFRFLERTEHNLEYYCIDALGNQGPIDEEKFKVTGNSFRIDLNRKWNLISVPFVLLDDNITKVFEDIEEDIASVWTYDAKTGDWYVYRPSAGGTSNLEEMNPGWGYWVMAHDDTELLIGGDLYNPVTTPPSRDLINGWNLIGLYGTEDEITNYNGPNGNADEAYCELYTLRNEESIYPPTKWSALVGYWEPEDPEFMEYGICDYTDLGAGYWVFMDEDKTYSRTTVCPEALVGLLCWAIP